MRKLTTLILSSLFFLQASAMDDARMMRYPDINGNLVAFVYAGDIWTVNANGGSAKRITSHRGIELFPKISPDGKWIAFSAEYSGSRQIWVMPSGGGTARQLTFYNPVGEMPPRGGFIARVSATVTDVTSPSVSTADLRNRFPSSTVGSPPFHPTDHNSASPRSTASSAPGNVIREDAPQTCGHTTCQTTIHNRSLNGPVPTSGPYGTAIISFMLPTAIRALISGAIT